VDIQLTDRTKESAMMAIQGPLANSTMAQLSDTDPARLNYYTGTTTRVCGYQAILSRTGYTGEDGCEIIVDALCAQQIWDEIFARADKIGGGVCGLAARDTLRLEAGMPLYGHELTEDINAAQTDLDFAIQWKDRQFVGRNAILTARQDASLPVRVGLELEGRRAAREGCSILAEGKNIGTVTSGTFAPTLQKSISMGYVQRHQAAVGNASAIDIRGKVQSARIVELPFYRRN
jgi:aminomethyltransferase